MKTRYELHWWCANERTFYSDSKKLNNKRFQKEINFLHKCGDRFEIIEITEKVIASSKTLRFTSV